ncbi:flavohemoglobin expression-modulating QEGLA motif protein [Shinella pollutisoli]|uniref:Flavohemoglobin expression-modulating QEGLA motif protein n=1 Tax=Shinella pollutisoli TaxID=2250594 RepID=A0ABV7DKB1_9HYPH
MTGGGRPKGDLERVAEALAQGMPIRLDLARRGRLYIDRPLPFIAVHVGRRAAPAARAAAMANAAYLLAGTLAEAAGVVRLVGEAMREQFGAFLVIDLGELSRDQLAADAPYLAPFEIAVSASADRAAEAALSAFVGAVEKIDARYRAPRIVRHPLSGDPHAGLARRLSAFPTLTIRFAPIYRAPKSRAIYPELQERLVAHIVDAGLKAAGQFSRTQTALAPPTHRALGRRVFVDAVVRADRAIDEIAASFDFLLAVTPINADAAWTEFEAAGCARAPTFLYRPLEIDVAARKKALFSIALDRFEDPVLAGLYREKQQELDLQLSMLAAREDSRFVEMSRALYGSVDHRLEAAARRILEETAAAARRRAPETVDYRFVERRAKAMIARYAGESQAFSPAVEVRDDLPSGLMVSNDRLLIARTTAVARDRVEALLSHEVGVHLLTYCNGSGHGLRLFRSGLAGYEGAQEGLAVLAEYLSGGMTVARLRLIAARVVACAAMLDGADFVETFRLVSRDHGFPAATAFNLALRIHRGGGLAKDAIYLRGLMEILAHLGGGGVLEPFWLGKIAARHFAVMQELSQRGLLKAPRLTPQFLSARGAGERLARLRTGLSPIDLIN